MSKFFIYFFYFSTLKWKKSIDENTRFKDNSFLPCVLVQNKIDLVNEDIVKDDIKFINFANKNNFIKCFRTSVKKNINVDNTMDFLIEYIINKLEEIKIKNLDKNEEKNQKIILSSEHFEVTKESNTINCCSDMNVMKNEEKYNNKNNRNSDNSNSTNGISDEDKKEIE